LFGDRVHVGTEEPERTESRIREALQAAGIELKGVRAVEPTLEDVFVSVLAGENGGDDAER
jgi:ABC-2 type transport system ATP-binding protein